MKHSTAIAVVAIDGPTASGKGTVASLVAKALGFHYLDSGAIYRVLAVAVAQADLDPNLPGDLQEILALSASLPVQFKDESVLLDGVDVSQIIRTEDAGVMASRLGVVPEVRAGLLQRQRDFCKAPGLVADGRDMGSVVFPEATLKVFLTASARIRAERRMNQLESRGLDADFQAIYDELVARDRRDSERAVAPLKQCSGALVLDSSSMSIDDVLEYIISHYKKVGD